MKSNKLVYLLGCSFTRNVKGFNTLWETLTSRYNIINIGESSRSNFQILEDVKKRLPTNCKVVIQWSSLSRPNGILDYEKDWNKPLNDLADKQKDPLTFLIQTFINVVTQTKLILEEKNIESFQYIGWRQWEDSEINTNLHTQLTNLPIHWVSTGELEDCTDTTCWNYNYGRIVPNTKNFLWTANKWGGMSEWIRYNVTEFDKRYISKEDPHPSEYATLLFYKKIIIPEIDKLLNH
jgi:hypothetical protein